VSDSLRDLDHTHVWHPFTQQLGWSSEEAPIIERAEGTDLIDTEGRRYIDGVSSLWCNVHGHRHPDIDAAVRAQLDRVAHSTMLGLTHPPAIELAERLVRIAPPGLERVFYSDSGSTATEIALKMAFQYWQQRGGDDARKTRFVSLRHAYHGDTVGSVSVGGIDLFHTMYRPLLFDTLKADPGDADELEFVLASHPGEVAAVIVEPLVQGAAGMIMQPEGYLAAVRDLCDRHGALLICDEVATGFGRTGRMFACEHEAVSPDLLCVAKGLTGGYMPLAATLATEAVYEGFLGQFHEFRTFFHGHTYTGNPLACAAALATLEVFERERTLDQLQAKIAVLERLLRDVEGMRAVREVRQRGFMVGIELDEFPLEARMGHQVALEARRRGAIVRPLGDVIVLMPPLSISVSDLTRLVDIVRQSIAVATVPRIRKSAESSPHEQRGAGDPVAAQRPGANRDTAVA
jgi:adenosylmethionine-8-amino-7-oxononanoate aminotransferase